MKNPQLLSSAGARKKDQQRPMTPRPPSWLPEGAPLRDWINPYDFDQACGSPRGNVARRWRPPGRTSSKGRSPCPPGSAPICC